MTSAARSAGNATDAYADLGLDPDDLVRLKAGLHAAFGDAVRDIRITEIQASFSLSSRMFLIETEARRGVARVVIKPGLALEWQAEAIRILASEGLGPDPLDISADGRVQVLAHVDEEQPKWHVQMRPGMAEALARTLRRLHAIDAKRGRINLETGPSGLPHDSRKRVTEALDTTSGFTFVRYGFALLTALEQRIARRGIAHNDLHVGNVLYDGLNFYLIDLEAIGLGEPCLDLAVLCHMIARNPGAEEMFLRTYFEGPVPRTMWARLVLSKTVSALRYGISAFSNCREFPPLASTDIADVRTYLAHDEAKHGALDFTTDRDLYRPVHMLLKLGFGYATGPDFIPAMALLSGAQSLWANGYAPAGAVPLRQVAEQETSGAVLVALARLLRALGGSGNSLPDPDTAALEGFEALADMGITPEPCHGTLSPGRILLADEGGLWRAWCEPGDQIRVGPPFVDLATLALHLALAPDQELFVLACLCGGAVSQRQQSVYALTKQASRERMISGLCETAQELTAQRRAGIARESGEILASRAYARAHECVQRDEEP